MRKLLICLSLILSYFFVPVHAESVLSVTGEESRVSLMEDWEKEGADGVHTVQLPDDCSLDSGYTTEADAEGGFLLGAEVTYRKKLVFEPSVEGKTVLVTFAGVYMNASVWLDDELLAVHPSGYTQFIVDLSGLLTCDGKTEHTLRVDVQHQSPSSRWYSGTGIERNVELLILDPVHVREESVYVTCEELKQGKTDLDVAFTLDYSGQKMRKVKVTAILKNAYGEEVARSTSETLKVEGEQEVHLQIEPGKVQYWSPSDPNLYDVEIVVEEGKKIIDETHVSYGFRWFECTVEDGFILNGDNVFLKGVCLHHDLGALGAISNESAWRMRLRALKDMGVNAIRTAHNPVDRIFLDLCNEMGFLVIEEAFDTWTNSKNYNMNDAASWFETSVGDQPRLLYAQSDMTWAQAEIESMVRLSRNDPSVILYSVGNEILGNIGGDTSRYPEIAAQLCAWVKNVDDTRPVTIADNMTVHDNETQLAMDQAIIDAGGVVGLNYATAESADKYRERYPDWPMYASETTSAYGSRDWYSSLGIDEKNHEVTSYDNCSVEWGDSAKNTLEMIEERPWIFGMFIWTGYDYLGEPEPWNGLTEGSVIGDIPAPHSSYFGILDTAGLEKDSYYYYRSKWNTESLTLHILPCWEEEQVKKDWLGRVPVVVYSNAPSVELFLNGKSLGKQSEEDCVYEWNVTYSAGTLEAVAYDENGNVLESEAGRTAVTTPGEAAGLQLTVDRKRIANERDEVDRIVIQRIDEEGNPIASNETVRVEVEGAGKLLAMDNGDPMDLNPYRSDTRSLFQGKAVAYVAPTETGFITVHVYCGDQEEQIRIAVLRGLD